MQCVRTRFLPLPPYPPSPPPRIYRSSFSFFFFPFSFYKVKLKTVALCLLNTSEPTVYVWKCSHSFPPAPPPSLLPCHGDGEQTGKSTRTEDTMRALVLYLLDFLSHDSCDSSHRTFVFFSFFSFFFSHCLRPKRETFWII